MNPYIPYNKNIVRDYEYYLLSLKKDTYKAYQAARKHNSPDEEQYFRDYLVALDAYETMTRTCHFKDLIKRNERGIVVYGLLLIVEASLVNAKIPGSENALASVQRAITVMQEEFENLNTPDEEEYDEYEDDEESFDNPLEDEEEDDDDDW